MNKAIVFLITEIALIDCDTKDERFTERLKKIQEQIGVESDDFANKWFSDYEDEWRSFKPNDKRDLLIDYVREEINWLVEDLDME